MVRVITLRETLYTRMYKKSSHHDPRDNEHREVATTCNTRNLTKYRAPIKYTDKLAYTDIEIKNTNLRKDFINNTIKQPIQHEKPIQNGNLR
jgi:hypothetical protein